MDQLPHRRRLKARGIADGYLVKIDESGNPLGPGTSVAHGDLISIRLSTKKRIGPAVLRIKDICDRPVGQTNCVAEPQHLSKEEPWRLGAGYKESARWCVPKDLASGVYFIAGHKDLMFVVRPDREPVDVLILISTNTFNAYSRTKGRSLYRHPVHSPEMSFYRPQNASKPDEWIDMAKWLATDPMLQKRVGFITDADLETSSILDGAKALVVLPHSEYWSRPARISVDKFIARGGNVVLASGNAMWWQVRLEGEHKDRLVCYKSDGTSATDRQTDKLRRSVAKDRKLER